MVFESIYQEFIARSRYARFLSDENRREDWPETVDRYISFMVDYVNKEHSAEVTLEEAQEFRSAIADLKVMPSMRALMTAGPALERDHMAGYNCAYLPFDSIRSFDEEMYILMNGTGVGFSVEEEYVSKLPVVAEEFHPSDTIIVVNDSRAGWAKSFRELISLLYSGQIPRWDMSAVRPAGAVLKTFGGRASGPQPLADLFEYCVRVFKGATGRRLTSIEVHDIACMVANIVVVGGVRRSALISLSDLSDDLMRDAKSGNWWQTVPHRRLANNSAVYEERPTIGMFMSEWLALYRSKSGERGIFNRDAVRTVINNSNKFREQFEAPMRRIGKDKYGINPCSEVILREYEFCNLTSVQVRPDDDVGTLEEKVRIATILGTMQSCLTKFRYISKKWSKNCEEERLLGVSLNGIFDNAILSGGEGQSFLRETLSALKRVAIETNVLWAKRLNINASVAITVIKPEGTTSALNGTASGIHPRHSAYYIRHVRNDLKDPLTKFLQDAGIPWEHAVEDDSTVVFKFPIKAPLGALIRGDITAVSHLELWKTYQQYWCEHKPSVSISVKEHEWLAVGNWVYQNFEWVSGISFFPWSDHVYKQAPFQECSKEEYDALYALTPSKVDWKSLSDYESYDQTTGVQALACSSSEGCEL